MTTRGEPDPSNTYRSCRICRFRYKTGTAGHTAKNCPLNEMQCRALEPTTSAYHLPGPCLSGNCTHNLTCSVCHLKGHSSSTQKYTALRWRMKDGKPCRSDHQPALNRFDFVCKQTKDSDVEQILQNVVTASAEAALGKARQADVSKTLRSNLHEAGLTGDRVVELMVEAKSKAAVLDPRNRANFDLVRKNREIGAVAANAAAARELESSVDDSDDLSSSSESSKERGGRRRSSRSSAVPQVGKEMKAHMKGRRARTSAAAREIVQQSASAAGERGGSSRRSPSTRSPRSAATPVRPSSSRKGKGVKRSKSDVYIVSDSSGSVDTGRGWPSGALVRFSTLLPAVKWAPLASLTPTGLADAVLAEACQLPVEEADQSVRQDMMSAAVENGLRGFMVSCGQYSAAHIAEFLCFSLPPLVKETYLPCVAGGVVQLHADAMAAAAAAREQALFVPAPYPVRARPPPRGSQTGVAVEAPLATGTSPGPAGGAGGAARVRGAAAVAGGAGDPAFSGAAAATPMTLQSSAESAVALAPGCASGGPAAGFGLAALCGRAPSAAVAGAVANPSTVAEGSSKGTAAGTPAARHPVE